MNDQNLKADRTRDTRSPEFTNPDDEQRTDGQTEPTAPETDQEGHKNKKETAS